MGFFTTGPVTAPSDDAFGIAVVGGISDVAQGIIRAISGSSQPTPSVQAQQTAPISNTTIAIIAGVVVVGGILLLRK